MSKLNEYLKMINNEKLQRFENKKFNEYNKQMENSDALENEIDGEITLIDKDFKTAMEQQITKDKKDGMTIEDYKGDDNFEEGIKLLIEKIVDDYGTSKDAKIKNEVEEYFYKNYKNKIIQEIKRG